MNRKIAFMMTAALLLGTATLPGVSVRAAVAAAGVQATAATQKASPTLSDQFFRVEWTAKPGRTAAPGSPDTSTTSMGRQLRTWSSRSASSMLRAMRPLA